MSDPNEFEGEPDYFCWLLDRAMPWSGGYAVVLEAYFDASKRDGGVFCVAAFAFEPYSAKKATVKWRRLWGKTQCHMTDLSASPPQGDFKGWTNDQTKRRIEAAIPIINEMSSFGVAVSCDIAELARAAPTAADPGSQTILGGFRTPYAVCCHLAMASMARLTNDADIAYFFEYGDEFQGESQAFMGWIASHGDAARGLYGLRSHAVLKAEDCRLFEMPDILAWEWRKFVERNRKPGRGPNPMRGSLRALLRDELRVSRPTNLESVDRRCWHLSAEQIAHYFQRTAEYELFSDHPSDEALRKLKAAVAQGL